jgi:hypothetical protein
MNSSYYRILFCVFSISFISPPNLFRHASVCTCRAVSQMAAVHPGQLAVYPNRSISSFLICTRLGTVSASSIRSVFSFYILWRQLYHFWHLTIAFWVVVVCPPRRVIHHIQAGAPPSFADGFSGDASHLPDAVAVRHDNFARSSTDTKEMPSSQATFSFPGAPPARLLRQWKDYPNSMP